MLRIVPIVLTTLALSSSFLFALAYPLLQKRVDLESGNWFPWYSWSGYTGKPGTDLKGTIHPPKGSGKASVTCQNVFVNHKICGYDHTTGSSSVIQCVQLDKGNKRMKMYKRCDGPGEEGDSLTEDPNCFFPNGPQSETLDFQFRFFLPIRSGAKACKATRWCGLNLPYIFLDSICLDDWVLLPPHPVEDPTLLPYSDCNKDGLGTDKCGFDFADERIRGPWKCENHEEWWLAWKWIKVCEKKKEVCLSVKVTMVKEEKRCVAPRKRQRRV